MKKEEFRFRSTGNTVDIRAVRYLPEKEPIAILQIAHGMVEYIDRYDDFAKYLCDQGFLVCGNDHVGHGGSVNNVEEWGYFTKDNGNQVLLDDIYELTKIMKKDYPNKPYFLLGHSMGSFYGRQYLCEHGSELTAAIIMGTGFEPLVKVKAGMMVCSLIALFKGWKYRSDLVNDMAFGAYNKKFEPARTRVDWLSKDTVSVDKYINEPRCSFKFTLNGYYNMFTGIARLHDEKYLNRVPKDLPILFVSGKDDPVGSFGVEVINSADSLKAIGCKNVDVQLYQDDRHEILNETDKEQVYQDLYEWLSAKLK